jgi:hypothetical protein
VRNLLPDFDFWGGTAILGPAGGHLDTSGPCGALLERTGTLDL